ncbi:MAG: methylated-DNA--[protein]-cysteine S-methyltransferase [Bacteroidota bacterium]
MFQATVTTPLPIGPCALYASETGLVAVRLGEATQGQQAETGRAAEILTEASRQLQAYFEGQLRSFDLPLDLSGRSDFQRRVLQACSQVGYGQTATYGDLAARAGSARAARAVGQVMAQNQLALIIPCHRIIGSSGRLVGYGLGLDLKQELLRMEREQRGWSARMA